jgi:hypothetical protein
MIDKKRSGFVYTLSDQNGDIFYIGSTVSLEVRLQYHISASPNGEGSACEYIRNMTQWPTIESIEEITFFDISDLRKLEKYWIDQFRQWGFPLVNIVNNLNQSKKRKKASYESEEPLLLLLTTEDVMAKLKVSRATLNRWRKSKTIKAKKLNGVVRYRLSDIERAMK